MNKVILKGNVGADPEMVTLSSGTQVAEFSLATNRRWKDAEGERQEETSWHRCKIYGKRADVIMEYVNKGDELLVEGRINYRSYEDNEGTTKYFTEIVLDDFHFVGGPNRAETEDKPKKTVASKGKGKATAAKGKGKKSTAKKTLQHDDDDLPF